MEERVSFRNNLGQRIAGILHRPPGPGPHPAVILCHGMLSSKDGEKMVMIARELERAGMVALRFDFCFVGESEGKLFDMTYSQERKDLEGALEFVKGLRPRSLGLVGSSMGGGVAVLTASGRGDIGALALMASVVHSAKLPKNSPPGELERWRCQGFIDSELGPIGLGFIEDAVRQDIMGSARKLQAPTLIIHGENDMIIDSNDARELFEALPAQKRLVILPGADHRLSRPEDREHVAALIVGWFKEHLLRGDP